MSDYRFGDDYKLNYDHEHQNAGDDYDHVDWNTVKWVEIDGAMFVAEHTCLIDGVTGGGDCGTTTYRLSCGHVAVMPMGARFRHCPECGAKVAPC